MPHEIRVTDKVTGKVRPVYVIYPDEFPLDLEPGEYVIHPNIDMAPIVLVKKLLNVTLRA